MAIYDSEGQILVKAGDSISKYHLAIFGNFGNPIAWRVFARPPDPPGKIPKTITNYDLIFAGETLLYVPEWKKKHPSFEIPVRGSNPMSPEEFDLLVRRLNFEAGLSINLAEKYAYKYIKFIQDGNSGVGGVEAIDAAVRYMKFASSIVGNIMTVVNGEPSYAGIAFFQLGGVLAWINARKQGIRYVTLRAAAYGLTSWTYGDPPPAYPLRLRDNLPKGPVTDPMLTVGDFMAEWDDTVARVRQAMGTLAQEYFAGKPSLKASLVFNTNNAKELCRQAMTAMESKYLSSRALPFLPPFVLESVHMAFFSPEPDYPN